VKVYNVHAKNMKVKIATVMPSLPVSRLDQGLSASIKIGISVSDDTIQVEHTNLLAGSPLRILSSI